MFKELSNHISVYVYRVVGANPLMIYVVFIFNTSKRCSTVLNLPG